MTAEDLAPELETEGLDEATAAEPGRTSAWSALEHRDFRLFWIGLVVSNIGTWMQQFGLGWLVVQLAIKDGVPQLAPFYLGLVGLSRALPGLAFGLFGGVVADRADRRRLLLVTQSSAAVAAAVLAFLAISNQINIVEIVLISALNSIIFSFDAPTRQAMVPRLVSETRLMSAIGLNSAAFNGATLVGPLIGGVLIIPFGVGGLMLINAISYLAVVAALFVISPQPIEVRTRLSMLASIREGLAYIRRAPVRRSVGGNGAARSWSAARSCTACCSRCSRNSAPSSARWCSSGSRASRSWCSSGWRTRSCKRARRTICAAAR